MTRTVLLLAAVAAFLAGAPAAFAQGGPDAGQNEFFFHGNKPDPTFDGRPPEGGEQTQTIPASIANADSPENPLAIYWTEPAPTAGEDVLAAGAVGRQEAGFPWFFSSPHPAGGLVGVEAAVTPFALPAHGDA